MRSKIALSNKRVRDKRLTTEDRLYRKIATLLPSALAQRVIDIARDTRIPISRLVAYAIDNELDCKPPFNYPITMPTTDYVPNLYNKEALAIFNFLKQYPKGQPMDSMILLRRNYGIEERYKVMEGIRELLYQEMVKIFKSDDRDIIKITREQLRAMGIRDVVGRNEEV